jgi:hypothetical protein
MHSQRRRWERVKNGFPNSIFLVPTAPAWECVFILKGVMLEHHGMHSQRRRWERVILIQTIKIFLKSITYQLISCTKFQTII